MSRHGDLRKAGIGAGEARRAVGAIPGVFRQPGAAAEAHGRWEQAHADLQSALNELPEPGAGA